LIVKYLNSNVKPDRQAILAEMAMLEGSSVEHWRNLLAHMRPPLEDSPERPKADDADAAITLNRKARSYASC